MVDASLIPDGKSTVVRGSLLQSGTPRYSEGHVEAAASSVLQCTPQPCGPFCSLKIPIVQQNAFCHAALDSAVSNTIATPLQTALSSSRAVHCYTSLIFERDETHVPASTRNLFVVNEAQTPDKVQ